jgi:hypothetical protein
LQAVQGLELAMEQQQQQLPQQNQHDQQHV